MPEAAHCFLAHIRHSGEPESTTQNNNHIRSGIYSHITERASAASQCRETSMSLGQPWAGHSRFTPLTLAIKSSGGAAGTMRPLASRCYHGDCRNLGHKQHCVADANLMEGLVLGYSYFFPRRGKAVTIRSRQRLMSGLTDGAPRLHVCTLSGGPSVSTSSGWHCSDVWSTFPETSAHSPFLFFTIEFHFLQHTLTRNSYYTLFTLAWQKIPSLLS